MRKPNDGVSIAAIVAKEMVNEFEKGSVIGFSRYGIGHLAEQLLSGEGRGSWEHRKKHFIYWFYSKKRLAIEEHRYEKAQEIFSALERVYYQLRFVEKDHIVFDPLTGDEAPATGTHIVKLWERLASSEIFDLKAPLTDFENSRGCLLGWAYYQIDKKVHLNY